jgi:hypothetical protein
VANGFDLEAIEVGAAKPDAGAARRGQQAQVNRRTAMEADAAALDRSPDCLFVFQ